MFIIFKLIYHISLLTITLKLIAYFGFGHNYEVSLKQTKYNNQKFTI